MLLILMIIINIDIIVMLIEILRKKNNSCSGKKNLKIIFDLWPTDPLACATDIWQVSVAQVTGLQKMWSNFFFFFVNDFI